MNQQNPAIAKGREPDEVEKWSDTEGSARGLQQAAVPIAWVSNVHIILMTY